MSYYTHDYIVILYVADQARSRDFYAAVLALDPELDVPGMTEFQLRAGFRLGLMPEQGIAKILLPTTPDPAAGHGIPRCELYLRGPGAEAGMARALAAGARRVQDLQDRDWGDRVGYVVDMDGHVLAFAEPIS
jgi:catechol 2,3-dioxygenase-like lactoylglutathione lyase family enzyme